MQQSKPWQWLIDDINQDIAYFEKHGFDKENPELFERFKQMLEKAKAKQDRALKGYRNFMSQN